MFEGREKGEGGKFKERLFVCQGVQLPYLDVVLGDVGGCLEGRLLEMWMPAILLEYFFVLVLNLYSSTAMLLKN